MPSDSPVTKEFYRGGIQYHTVEGQQPESVISTTHDTMLETLSREGSRRSLTASGLLRSGET